MAWVALPEPFATAEVFDMDESSDRSIWIATAEGVVRLGPESPDRMPSDG